MDFLATIKQKAIAANKHIILPESNDLRILKAARELTDRKIAKVSLIGDEGQVHQQASDLGVDISDLRVISPELHPKLGFFTEKFHELRKVKGITWEEAGELMKNPLYFATMMVYDGEADGMVAGAVNTTADVLRPALQVIKTHPAYRIVSGAFLMYVPNCALGNEGLFVFADCAVNINPSSRSLAEIGIQSAHTARHLGQMEPVIGFLSFSTKGSARHGLAGKVAEAVEIAKSIDPALEMDGELQVDSAIIEAVGRQKAPGSPVAGRANVLVFPDLQSGNIGYKLVERLGQAVAIGPILQGLARPVNDLSRGCNVDDIINMVAITAVQATNP